MNNKGAAQRSISCARNRGFVATATTTMDASDVSFFQVSFPPFHHRIALPQAHGQKQARPQSDPVLFFVLLATTSPHTNSSLLVCR